MKKLNKYPTARSEYAIRSVLYKLRSNKTSEDEAIKLSRVTSLLPSITNTHSLHFKTDNISPFN